MIQEPLTEKPSLSRTRSSREHGRLLVQGNTAPRPSVARIVLVVLAFGLCASAAGAASLDQVEFPPPLDSYADAHLTSVWDVLKHRVQQEPFNLWATLVFLLAIIHTFLTHKFLHWAHVAEGRHRERLRKGQTGEPSASTGVGSEPTCIAARVLHFFGEVEVVFGIWVIPLFILMSARLGWHQAVNYLDHRVRYIEPVFVIVIMILSSTRPIVRLAEQCLRGVAMRGGGGPGAWWLAILTIGPLLGSLITEPAAMTISALLLGRQFYALKPKPHLAYATLGLLFVNVSVGGVLTHFAAPPVLMVAAPWGWNSLFMFRHFGWVAVAGILIANAGYYLVFRRSMAELGAGAAPVTAHETKALPGDPIPAWVTIGHLSFLAWTVANAHYPVLVIAGFLFFLAFYEVTVDYQSELQMRSPILVGFFLAGLVTHGGLQQWWLAPVLSRLKELPLMLGAIGLTAFNDNAAVTYLSTLVPNMSEGMKYAVVAGAVTGGGLTVIANAPNPAGQSLLGRYFPEGVAPMGLFLGALPATIILALCFLFLG